MNWEAYVIVMWAESQAAIKACKANLHSAYSLY